MPKAQRVCSLVCSSLPPCPLPPQPSKGAAELCNVCCCSVWSDKHHFSGTTKIQEKKKKRKEREAFALRSSPPLRHSLSFVHYFQLHSFTFFHLFSSLPRHQSFLSSLVRLIPPRTIQFRFQSCSTLLTRSRQWRATADLTRGPSLTGHPR